MDSGYLREYVELAKHLNFTETARLLSMSQPTLSKHINQLEKMLKLELFDREGNALRLTEEGTALLPYAYQITDAQNEFLSKAAELRVKPPSRLVVSGLTDEEPSTEVLGFLVSLLSQKYGASFLEIKSRYNRDPREMLEANEVDLVFDPAPHEEMLDTEVIGALHVANLRLVALIGRDNPLSAKESVLLSELSNEVLLKYEGVYLSRSWSYIEDMFTQKGHAPKTRSCHCASVAELFAKCVNLQSSIIVVGCNFGKKIPAGIRSFCSVVPIVDESAVIPLYFLFRRDNRNPVLLDAIESIAKMQCPPLCFS